MPRILTQTDITEYAQRIADTGSHDPALTGLKNIILEIEAYVLSEARARDLETATLLAKPEPDTAGSMLREAAGIVEGVRQQTHGDKERSFQVIADFWNTYLQLRHLGARDLLTPSDVAMLMALLKVARSVCGTPIRDHFVDAGAYAALSGELALGGPKS